MKAFRIAAILVACALSGCALEAIEDEAVGEESMESRVDETAVKEEAGDDLAPTSSTWNFLSRESCIDLFGRLCSNIFPTDRCPSDPQGKSCTPIDRCWHVVSSYTVDLYSCR